MHTLLVCIETICACNVSIKTPNSGHNTYAEVYTEHGMWVSLGMEWATVCIIRHYVHTQFSPYGLIDDHLDSYDSVSYAEHIESSQ